MKRDVWTVVSPSVVTNHGITALNPRHRRHDVVKLALCMARQGHSASVQPQSSLPVTVRRRRNLLGRDETDALRFGMVKAVITESEEHRYVLLRVLLLVRTD